MRALVGLALAAAAAWTAPLATTASGATTRHPDATPIIEPIATPAPAYLPLAVRAYDARLPGPLGSDLRGWVAELRSPGRDRCAPATHVLLDRREGHPGATALAVLRAGRPGIKLDHHVGGFVEVGGLMDLAPPDCRVLTDWLLGVTTITPIEVLPRSAD